MNTPLRDEIAKLLKKRKDIPVKGTEVYEDGELRAMAFRDAELSEDEVIDQILNLVASKMPEKLRLSKKHQEYQDGHNDCLDSVKSILKGGTDE